MSRVDRANTSSEPTPQVPVATFDEYAGNYEAALAEGLAVSGESSAFFARGRVNWVAQLLRRRGERATRVMDFGCGRGAAVPLLREALGAESAIGVDVSTALLEVARAEFGSSTTQFSSIDSYAPDQSIDVAYCNGVFHHIPPPERAGAVNYVYQCLRPHGWFFLWENNPWNPGTRYVMSRIPFDRDAITLSCVEAAAMVRAAGFQVFGTRSLFYFPSALSALRPIERLLTRIPLGAQYCVIGQKPTAMR